MPSVGLSARLAMAVLKDIWGISRTAVPVVSEPVPYLISALSRTSEVAGVKTHSSSRDYSITHIS